MLNNKRVTEGLILTVIYLVLLFLSIYTPLGFVTVYFTLIPFILFSYRNGVRPSILFVFSNLIISIIVGGVFGLFVVALASSAGTVMGILYSRYNALSSIAGGVVLIILNFVFAIIVGHTIFNVNLVELFQETAKLNLLSDDQMRNVLGDNPQAQEIMTDYRNFFATIGQIMPFVIVSYAAAISLLNHFVTRLITKRLGQEVPELPPFRTWLFPRSILLYYLFTVGILMFEQLKSIYFLKLISINLYPLLQLILLIQGVSFVFYYSYVKNKGKLLPVIAVFLAIIPLLSQVIHILGIVDIGFGLRKKIKK